MRRYSLSRIPDPLKPFAILVLMVAGIAALVTRMPASALHQPLPQSSHTTPLPDQAAYVERVIDGDTLKLSSKERVRLIGIDTPELHENAKLYRDAKRSGQDVQTILGMGREAYRFTQTLVEGKTVRLEMDVQPRDKYGRLLAYVYLEDGTFVNAEIIRKGYAYPMTIPPNVRHAVEFKELFAEARRQRLGLWSVR